MSNPIPGVDYICQRVSSARFLEKCAARFQHSLPQPVSCQRSTANAHRNASQRFAMLRCGSSTIWRPPSNRLAWFHLHTLKKRRSPSRIWWGNVLFCSTNAARVVGTGKVRVLAEIAWSGLNGFQVAKIQLAMPDGSSFPNVAPRPPVAGRPLSQKKPAVPEPSCWWAPAIRTCLCPTWWLVIRAETLVCL